MLLAVSVGFMAATSSIVLADRAPTSDERQKIEATLRAEGFRSWGEIELDDGRWEVDDARHADGTKYELELDRSSFKIVKRERDD